MPLKKPKMSLEEAKEKSFSIESPRSRATGDKGSDGAVSTAERPTPALPEQTVTEAVNAPEDRQTDDRPQPRPVAHTASPVSERTDAQVAEPAGDQPVASKPSSTAPVDQVVDAPKTPQAAPEKPRSTTTPRRAKPKPRPAVTVETDPDDADGSASAAGFVGKAPPGAGAIIPVSAPIPSPGVSPAFDTLTKNRPADEIIQALLRKALNEYEPMLVDGSFKKAPTTYETDQPDVRKGEVWIRRKLSQPALDAARAHFDPFEIEAARSFGRMVATAALAVFFDKEHKA